MYTKKEIGPETLRFIKFKLLNFRLTSYDIYIYIYSNILFSLLFSKDLKINKRLNGYTLFRESSQSLMRVSLRSGDNKMN